MCSSDLNSDGSVDAAFVPVSGTPFNGPVLAVAVQVDGKVVAVGNFTVSGRQNVVRLNPDGTLDATFLNGLAGANSSVQAVLVQPDGKILIGGDFLMVNGVACNRLARLNGTDGSLDTSFNPGAGANATVRALSLDTLALLPNSTANSDYGKILVGGDFTGPSFGGAVTNKVATGGSVILTLSGTPASHGIANNDLVTVSIGDAVFDGTFPATVDNNLRTLTFTQTTAVVPSTAVSPVGFVGLQARPVNRVARLTSAGALDLTLTTGTTFADKVGTGPNGSVTSVARLTNSGGVTTGFLVAGDFTGPGFGVTVTARARDNMAGEATLTTATPHGLNVGDVVVISGVGSSSDGAAYDGTYRVKAFGTPLTTTIVYDNAGVTESSAVQSTASATKGNRFITRLARLNADGSFDAALSTDTGFDAAVSTLALQTVGSTSYLVAGGSFTSYQGIGGTGHDYLTRLVLGTTLPLDTAFNIGVGADNAINALAVEPGFGGRVVIGGAFTSFSGNAAATRVARINGDGTLDTAFVPSAFLLTAGTPTVNGVALDLNTNSFLIANVGKVVIGGAFTSIGGTSRNRIARLNSNGTLDATFGSAGIHRASGRTR